MSPPKKRKKERRAREERIGTDSKKSIEYSSGMMWEKKEESRGEDETNFCGEG